MDVEEECTISPGFEVSCCDVEGLRALCQRFDERPPAAATPKRRGRKPKGAAAGGRKRCEVELREALATLLAELEPHDARFAKAASRAKAKVMKESQEPDPPDKSGQYCTSSLGYTGETGGSHWWGRCPSRPTSQVSAGLGWVPQLTRGRG